MVQVGGTRCSSLPDGGAPPLLLLWFWCAHWGPLLREEFFPPCGMLQAIAAKLSSLGRDSALWKEQVGM